MTISRYLLVAAALTAAAPALAASGSLHASLRGQKEVPGPGKNDARGSATVRVSTARNRVCYNLSVRNLPRPTMAHIHRGGSGVSGPPVVTLRTPTGGMSRGCTGVTHRLARDLLRSPRGFYVNVHSKSFPDGAIRGQLTR